MSGGWRGWPTEPEITLPSLQVLFTPTNTLGHHGVVLPAQEASLPIWGRQRLSLAFPPHFLTSHDTLLPNLAIGLEPPHSSGLALRSPLQSTTAQKNSCIPSGSQPMNNQQHDTPKGSALLGETSQGMWEGVLRARWSLCGVLIVACPPSSLFYPKELHI